MPSVPNWPSFGMIYGTSLWGSPNHLTLANRALPPQGKTLPRGFIKQESPTSLDLNKAIPSSAHWQTMTCLRYLDGNEEVPRREAILAGGWGSVRGGTLPAPKQRCAGWSKTGSARWRCWCKAAQRSFSWSFRNQKCPGCRCSGLSQPPWKQAKDALEYLRFCSLA